jgi:hypothetical protein
MNKRKVEFILDDQENAIKKPKCDKIEILNQEKIPLQEINQNTIKSAIDTAKQNDIKNGNEISTDVIMAEENEKKSSTESKENKNASGETDEAQNQEKMKKLNSLNQIQTIKEMLKVTKSSGEPTVGGKATLLPKLPGLCVKGFGEISLPLCSLQAEELIKICKQATYGSNLVDSNAFELEAGKLEIKNGSWNHGLSKLVEKIADDIGCVGKVKANLSKMVLFKQGGHFKKHRDAKKEKGTFGTLIIQLPSNYTGGELIICGNRGAQFKYDFGQANDKSGYSVQYAAYYSDLEHEMVEVKSGYRLVLRYNLCWENGNGILLNDECSEAKVLSAFSILNESFVPLAVVLEDKYTDELFQKSGTNALKGIDNQRFGFLKNVSAKLPEDKKLNFYILKASLKAYDVVDDDPYPYRDYSSESSEEEDDDDEDDQVSCEFKNEISKTKKIERLFDSDGKMYQDVKFDFSFFDEIMDLRKNADEKADLEDRKAWSEASYDSTQDDSCCDENQDLVSTIYQKYFLMILPKSKELKLSFSISLSHGADKVLELWDSHASNEARFLNYFKLLLKKLKEKPKSGYSSCYSNSTDSLRDAQINKILDILFALNDVSLAQFYLSNCHYRYVESDCEKFANLIRQFGFEALKPSLSKYILPVKRNNIGANFSLIQVSISLKFKFKFYFF